MIIDGRAIADRSAQGMDPRSYLLMCHTGAIIAALERVASTAPPMVARINHGTWVASCECGAPRDKIPTPGCIVFLDVLLGWCVRCGNQAWGGGWRRITAPAESERRLIEAVLDCRPRTEDRNWEGETVEMLAAENAAHGDPIPDLDMVRIGPVHGPSVFDLAAPFSGPPAMRQEHGPRWWQKILGRR